MTSETSQAPVVEQQTEQPATNRGPIGPLDPNEPPPYDPEMRRGDILKGWELVKALRSKGVEITERDLERYNAAGEGPIHTTAPGQRYYEWGPSLDWAARTFPHGLLNRKQATDYIRTLGYPIGYTVLSQVRYARAGGPLFIKQGRDTFYDPEALRKWVEERNAAGRRHATPPKYLPLYAKRKCPEDPLDDPAPVSLLLAANGGKMPPPEHKDCPFVKHERCARFPRALCNLIHLPLDPALSAAYEAMFKQMKLRRFPGQ
jgi:hypothetical protein